MILFYDFAISSTAWIENIVLWYKYRAKKVQQLPRTQGPESAAPFSLFSKGAKGSPISCGYIKLSCLNINYYKYCKPYRVESKVPPFSSLYLFSCLYLFIYSL